MESIVTLVAYGIFGLLALIIGLILIFGQRVIKQWEYEAEFRDEQGREFGEFEIELSQVQKEEPNPTVKARLELRHASLTEHKTVQAYIGDRLVLEGMVTTPGRISIRRQMGEGDAGRIADGHVCRITIGGSEQFEEPLRRD